MKLAFFISSAGDTDLALSTIRSLEKIGEHQVVLYALTEVAHTRIGNFQSNIVTNIQSLTEILKQTDYLSQIQTLLTEAQTEHVYIGVPSSDNEFPYQIAQSIDNIPVLMAFEYMFKPKKLKLWDHLPFLQQKPNVRWGLPLPTTLEDFQCVQEKSYITGHLSIDKAYSAVPMPETRKKEVRATLGITKETDSYAFISGTTQPPEIDEAFLQSLLEELPNHNNIQVRFGIHPGIKPEDLDAYLTTLLKVYQLHPCTQFKFILPNTLTERVHKLDLIKKNPELIAACLVADVNGNDAAAAADRVAQAVSGALVNTSAIEGKSAYAHFEEPYLPKEYFADNLQTFFTALKQPARSRNDLGVPVESAAEVYANILICAG